MYEIVVNPASKSGRGLLVWQEVEGLLKEQSIPYNAHISSKAGDVKNIMEKITSDGADHTVIVLGGDGTFNESLQGVKDFSKISFGYIPTGSSNDLARDLGIPNDASKALNIITSKKNLQTFDIGKLTLDDGSIRYYGVGCGVGFDAAVCEEILHSKLKEFFNKLGLGKLTYLGIAVKEIFKSGKGSMKMQLFDENSNLKDTISYDKLIFSASMVHRYEGGGFMFCPDATGTDGMLHICAAATIRPLKILTIMPSAFKGKHINKKGIFSHTAKKVSITLSEPLWIHTDGEVIKKADQLSVECLPDQLKLYV